MKHARAPIDTPESVLQRAADRGQLITDWQRFAMNAWWQRGVRLYSPTMPPGQRPTYIELKQFPIPCNCSTCGAGAMIFPAEEGAERGYCICPKCSMPAQAVHA